MMDQIYPKIPIVSSSDSFINPWGLVSGKQYYVNTHLDQWKGIIKGTFNRYEQNKIIGKDEPIWSIVLMDWWGESNRENLYTQQTPCQIQLYLDPIEKLEFYEI
jgi:hypothetical protein